MRTTQFDLSSKRAQKASKRARSGAKKTPYNFNEKSRAFFKIRPLSMAGCQAASKADLMSENAKHVVIFCFLFFSINWTRI